MSIALLKPKYIAIALVLVAAITLAMYSMIRAPHTFSPGGLVILLAQTTPTETNVTIASWIETNTTFNLTEVKEIIETNMQNDLSSDVIVTSDYVEAVFKVRSFYDAFPYDEWNEVYVNVYARVYKDGLIIAWIPINFPEEELPRALYIWKQSDRYKIIPTTMKVVLDLCENLGVQVSDYQVIKHAMPRYPDAKKLVVMWPEKPEDDLRGEYVIAEDTNVLKGGWLVLFSIHSRWGDDWYSYSFTFKIDGDTIAQHSGSCYGCHAVYYDYGLLDDKYLEVGNEHAVESRIGWSDLDYPDWSLIHSFFYLFIVVGE